MEPDKTPKLGKRELDLMNALWSLGDATVTDVQAEIAKDGDEIAYNTVQTMLNRLERKELVSRGARGARVSISCSHPASGGSGRRAERRYRGLLWRLGRRAGAVSG